MEKLSSITERSGGRFIPLGGSSRQYIDLWNPEAAAPLSRRQVDNILSGEKGHYEKKAKKNKAQNSKLQKQRPARGRKSTLPKKKRKNSKKKAYKTEKGQFKNGMKWYRRYFSKQELGNKSAIIAWINYHYSRGAKFFYAAGVYNYEDNVTQRNLVPSIRITSKNSITLAVDDIIAKALNERGSSGSAAILTGIEFTVTYGRANHG